MHEAAKTHLLPDLVMKTSLGNQWTNTLPESPPPTGHPRQHLIHALNGVHAGLAGRGVGAPLSRVHEAQCGCNAQGASPNG